jgi:hypothetical protein
MAIGVREDVAGVEDEDEDVAATNLQIYESPKRSQQRKRTQRMASQPQTARRLLQLSQTPPRLHLLPSHLKNPNLFVATALLPVVPLAPASPRNKSTPNSRP